MLKIIFYLDPESPVLDRAEDAIASSDGVARHRIPLAVPDGGLVVQTCIGGQK